MDARTGEGRWVVPHVDDLGASHGANAAFLQLAAAGRVSCGAVMVPGAWFRELAEAAQADPSLDLGVHLTLTSEWRACRWAPISTVSRASGLIDDDGYLWPDLAGLRAHLVPEAAEAEMRAQIERAIAAGVKPTHLDAHMGAAWLPELLDAHVRLARDYGLFPVLPRRMRWAPDLPAYAACADALAETRAPMVDEMRGTLAVEAAALEPGWTRLIEGLSAGVTHLALHATTPGDFSAMSPQHAPWRYQEYAFLRDGGLERLLAKARVGALATRDLQAQWRAHLALKSTGAGPDACVGLVTNLH